MSPTSLSPMIYMSHITYSVWHFNIQALYMEIILLLDNDNHAYYLLYFHKFLFKSIIRRCWWPLETEPGQTNDNSSHSEETNKSHEYHSTWKKTVKFKKELTWDAYAACISTQSCICFIISPRMNWSIKFPGIFTTIGEALESRY